MCATDGSGKRRRDAVAQIACHEGKNKEGTHEQQSKQKKIRIIEIIRMRIEGEEEQDKKEAGQRSKPHVNTEQISSSRV